MYKHLTVPAASAPNTGDTVPLEDILSVPQYPPDTLKTWKSLFPAAGRKPFSIVAMTVPSSYVCGMFPKILN